MADNTLNMPEQHVCLQAWFTLLVFGSLQALLQLALPGRRHEGPTTPKGNTPVYKVCAFVCDDVIVMSHQA